jgi:hypothetical protein
VTCPDHDDIKLGFKAVLWRHTLKISATPIHHVSLLSNLIN